MLRDGTEVRLEPGDPYDRIATLTDDPCTRAAVAEAASFAWLPPSVPDPVLGADATVRLQATPTGAGTLEIVAARSTVLLAVVDAAGSRAEVVPIGVTVQPGGGAQDVAFAMRPGRCDAHAIAEDKQGTILILEVVLDGEERILRLPADDATRGALLAYVADSCGLG